MHILITGKTGLIGSAIEKSLLQEGHIIHYLTTNFNKIRYSKKSKGFHWDPSKNKIDIACLKDVDTIIHLSGASISKRWTTTYKQEILESRIQSTQLLFDTLSQNKHQVKQIISASAIGIYPDSLTAQYAEESTEISTSFLGEVSQKWEASIQQFQALKMNTCIIRIGLVLALKGGALPEMLKPIKYGLGSFFGNGNQYQSWIHIDDLSGVFLHAYKNRLHGTFNAVAPQPTTNKALTSTIAALCNKPLFLPGIPKFLMKLVLGEMHILLYESQYVTSDKIRQTGYTFQFESHEEALQDILTS